MRWMMTLRRSVSSRRRLTSSSLPIVVERARDHRFGDAELGREPAHGVRRRIEIDREQDRELARREVGLAVGDEPHREIAQQMDRLRGPQLDGHSAFLDRSFRSRIFSLRSARRASN